MIRFLYFFLLLTPTLLLTAQTNTWNGGTGNWETAANWSLNQVPTSSHDVVISDNGQVTVNNGNRYARSIAVQSSASLTVAAAAYLRAMRYQNTGSSLSNSGTVNIYGRMQTRHAYYTNQSIGILNSGQLNVYNGGTLDIQINQWGIQNVGQIDNWGRIYFNRHDYASYNHLGGNMANHDGGLLYARRIYDNTFTVGSGSTLINEGTIDFAYQIEDQGLLIAGRFENRPSGYVRLRNFGTTGLNSTGSDAQIINEGRIRLEGPNLGDTGIRVSGDAFFENRIMGEIEFVQADIQYHGVILTNDGIFINAGSLNMNLDGTYNGIRSISDSEFFNTGSLLIDGTINTGISIYSSHFENQGGTTEIRNPGATAIITNTALVYNHDCGELITNGSILANADGDIASKNAWWIHESGPVSANTSGLIHNDGVIHDPNGAFGGSSANNVLNDGVILGPQNYVPVAGTNYYNVFDLGNSNQISISSNWTRFSYGGQSLGYFSQAGNKVGLSQQFPSGVDHAYVRVDIDNCGERSFRIDFAGPSARPAPGLNPFDGDATAVSSGESTIFPNPIHTDFQVQFPSNVSTPNSLQLFDLNGRQLAQWPVTAGSTNPRFTRPSNLPAGAYLLSIQYEDGTKEQQRLLFQ